MNELAKLAGKSLAEVIRFSTNRNFRLSCLESLQVTNSYDAEKVMQQKLVEMGTGTTTPVDPATNPAPAEQRGVCHL